MKKYNKMSMKLKYKEGKISYILTLDNFVASIHEGE